MVPSSGYGVDPDLAPMLLDDSLAGGESYAGARNTSIVQPLEEPKNTVPIFALDADAVVGYRELPLRSGWNGGDMDGKRALSPILDRVRDQILEDLNELRFVSPNDGQRIVSNCSTAVGDCFPQIQQTDLEGLAGIDGSHGRNTLANEAGVTQERINQFAHPDCAAHYIVDELIGFGSNCPR